MKRLTVRLDDDIYKALIQERARRIKADPSSPDRSRSLNAIAREILKQWKDETWGMTNCHDLAKRFARLMLGIAEVQKGIRVMNCDPAFFASTMSEELRAMGASEEFIEEAVKGMGIGFQYAEEFHEKVEELERRYDEKEL